MVLTLYFSKRQIQSLSIDQQTRVLNDLDEKFHNMTELAMEDPLIQAGWLQWMRNSFRKGTIKETWKQVESDRWLNPAFQNFINTEIVGAILEPNQK